MKKLALITSSLILGASLFTGCAVKTGNDTIEEVTQTSVAQKIINGKTTKDEVRKEFGEPLSVNFMENGLEKWEYHHTRKVAKGINYVPVANWFVKGTNDTKKTLVILFDGETVEKHSFSSSEGETKGGLIR